MIRTPTFTLAQVVQWTGGELAGDGALALIGVCTLDRPSPQGLGFLVHRELPRGFDPASIGALITLPEARVDHPSRILHPEPRSAFARVLSQLVAREPALLSQYEPSFLAAEPVETRIHPTAVVSSSAQLEPGVVVGPLCVVEDGAEIGAGTVLSAQVFVGRDARIGSLCYLFPGVRVLARVRLGDGVVVGANTVVGGEGFGFVSDQTGHHKIPHLGSVSVESQVELGALCAVDRGVVDDTQIGQGSKLDNLVQLGHNVRLGKNNLVAAQTGFSGGARTGEWCVFGGQVGVGGHLTIGDRVTAGGQAGIMGDVEPGKTVSGYPAVDHHRSIRAYAALLRLPELIGRIRKLERRLEELGKGKG